MSVLDFFWPVDDSRSASVSQIQEVQKPLPERPRPQANLAVKTIPEDYLKLASDLDFSPGELLDTQIRNFLIEQQIPIYNVSKVIHYMTALAKSNNANFFWRPLRQRDADIFGGWHWGLGEKHDYYNREDSVCRPYDLLVPTHILADVKTVQNRFGDKVAFFVSHYEADAPDPFLLVTAPNTEVKNRIIGAWDEPGFGVV